MLYNVDRPLKRQMKIISFIETDPRILDILSDPASLWRLQNERLASPDAIFIISATLKNTGSRAHIKSWRKQKGFRLGWLDSVESDQVFGI